MLTLPSPSSFSPPCRAIIGFPGLHSASRRPLPPNHSPGPRHLPPPPRQGMHRLVTRRCVQNSSPRSRLPLQSSPPNLTRRTAHSGLVVFPHLRRLPTRTYHLILQFSGPFPQRTHNCGALSERDLGSTVVLSGWLLPERSSPHLDPFGPFAYVTPRFRRASKSLSFFPLKDSYGTTQLAVHRDHTSAEKLAALSTVPPESVVLIQGRVRSRPIQSKRDVRFHLSNLYLFLIQRRGQQDQ